MSATGAPAALDPSAQAQEHAALPIWQGPPPEGGQWRPAASSLRATAEPSARQQALGALPALVGAAILAGIAFGAGGGLGVGDATYTEIAITLAGGTLIAVLAAAVALGALPHPGRLYGIASALLLGAFAAFAALSVIWSVQPEASWIGAGHLFAYAAFFAAALALARIAPARYGAVLGAIAISSVVVCAYALLTKVFPGALAAHETYARLQAPYGYWIATGLTAALGVIATLWAGARRDGHAALRILAYPALVIELVTLMLTYSRGPLAALLIGIACFILIVPLRLRTIALLGCAALAAAVPVAFAFASHALSSEDVPLAARSRTSPPAGRSQIVLAGSSEARSSPASARCCSRCSAASPPATVVWPGRSPMTSARSPTPTPPRPPTRQGASPPWPACAHATGRRHLRSLPPTPSLARAKKGMQPRACATAPTPSRCAKRMASWCRCWQTRASSAR